MKANPEKGAERAEMIRRLLKYLIILALLGTAGIAGYALLFDLPADQVEVVIPVAPLGQ